MVYAVIMAGGSGTRFWPKSTQKLPKQFLSLFGEGTMIQETARRIEPLIPQERIMVVTNDKYVQLVKDQLPSVPEQNIVGEVMAKNTAPCVAIAAEMLYKKDPDAIMVVLPADHHIEDSQSFINYLNTAIEKARAGENLVTIGINPDRPETGYGYIHGNNTVKEELKGHTVHPVKAFKEKPDKQTAQKFLESGNYYWNSGMFIWSAKNILNEFKKHLPEMYTLVKESSESLFTENHKSAVDSFYRSCDSVSIDYGIMEQAKRVFVVPGEFGWNDVGSWTAAYELDKKGDHKNVVHADFATFSEASDNYVLSKSGKMISIVGLEGVAVVETDDAILICKLDKAQNVKEIVEELKAKEEFRKFL